MFIDKLKFYYGNVNVGEKTILTGSAFKTITYVPRRGEPIQRIVDYINDSIHVKPAKKWDRTIGFYYEWEGVAYA